MPKTAFSYPEGYVDERIVEHWDMADDFINVFETNYFGSAQAELSIGVNDSRIALAIASAYKDIERYKMYHQDDPEEERLDCVKRCAYLLKWFVKLKPLYVKLPEGGLTENGELAPLEMANEFLALYFFEQHLSVEMEKNVQLDEVKTAELVYDMMYRNLSEGAWIAVFQMVKDCVEFGSVEHTPFLEEVLVPA